ncbi:MAG: diaminopimelate decarboxylase, partial [Clostridiales Family XIII bacterium]|nr:diaminopimelate decarboxylase [Clostridiales Family XIII bacterium]
MLHTNVSINEAGHLAFAGADVTELAAKYGTPLHLLDEARLRENCRTYVRAMKKHFGENAMPAYASKALSLKTVYRIVDEEGLGADVVSPGELYAALAAGFPPGKLIFHGSNKTDADIKYGVDSGVGWFVVDSIDELNALEAYASAAGAVQNVLLRITPGIDPHTFEAVKTGRVDSKFGAAVETGQALELALAALAKGHIKVCGYHCHIGSQIFEREPFTDASRIMLEFSAAVRDASGFEAEILNLGGGFGVRYTENDPVIDIEKNIAEIAVNMRSICQAKSLTMPRVFMEPGRSIVADAMLTVYTVGSVKQIPGFKNYVSIDGGMTDNPRYALYRSPYTVVAANRASGAADFTCAIAGRCCESGDLIQENVNIPRPVRGDLLAVLVTGAYNYSMASHYNRIPKLPIVMIATDG